MRLSKRAKTLPFANFTIVGDNLSLQLHYNDSILSEHWTQLVLQK
jgi:hypothetical protein